MIATCDEDGIRRAVAIVKKGGTVIFPTDTVYGLGCDPRNPDAVQKIYKIKGRDESKRLPVLGYSITEISKIALFDETSKKIAEKFWPGPLTLVLGIKDSTIARSLGLADKIAVRVPDHPCMTSLLKECKLLVGTSANRSGLPPFKDAKDIEGRLEGYDILLDGGAITNSVESTIVEVDRNQLKIIRHGKISEKELRALL